MRTHNALTLPILPLLPLLSLLACGPEAPCREEDFLHGEHLPHERTLTRQSEDGHAFEVVLRFNDAAEPLVDDWAARLRVLPRERLQEDIARVGAEGPPGDAEMPAAPDPLPIFAVTLRPKDPAVHAEAYAFRASLRWLLAPDLTGSFEGVSAPQGFGVAGCREGLLTSSSLPYVHLAGIHSADGSTGAVVALGRGEAALVTGEPTTHVPVVANGFYVEPVFVELGYGC